MSNSVEQITALFMDRYGNDKYQRADGSWMDEGHANAHRVLTAANSLTGAARGQFAAAYTFDAAMEGGVYVADKVRAAAKYQELCEQAPALGIRLFGRGFEQF